MIKFCALTNREEGGEGGRKKPFSPYEDLNGSLSPIPDFSPWYHSTQRMLQKRTKGSGLGKGDFSGRGQDGYTGRISMRLDGTWPKETRDSKEQALKDSHHPVFQLHSQGSSAATRVA